MLTRLSAGLTRPASRDNGVPGVLVAMTWLQPFTSGGVVLETVSGMDVLESVPAIWNPDALATMEMGAAAPVMFGRLPVFAARTGAVWVENAEAIPVKPT